MTLYEWTSNKMQITVLVNAFDLVVWKAFIGRYLQLTYSSYPRVFNNHTEGFHPGILQW